MNAAHAPSPASAGTERFADRRVLVTGGSRGIAAALVRGLAHRGAEVIVNYSAAHDAAAGLGDAADALCAELLSAGLRVQMLEQDLSLPEAGQRLAQAALERFGAIDSVVLSASVQVHRTLVQQSAADIARQLQINLVANIEVLQVLLEPMARARFGRVLTIGSIQERLPSQEMPVYAMTKAALRNLVENLAVHHGADGITVNNLAPGLVRTDRNAFRRREPGAWEAVSARANPMGRAGLPEELVAAALLLLSREAAFISGATLDVSGAGHVSTVMQPTTTETA